MQVKVILPAAIRERILAAVYTIFFWLLGKVPAKAVKNFFYVFFQLMSWGRIAG